MKQSTIMKKPYILPQARSLRFTAHSMLAASPGPGQHNDEVTPGARSDEDFDDYGNQYSERNTWPRRGNSAWN